MVEYRYAKGRIAESVQFIAREVAEFRKEYASKTWDDYHADSKLQKLMERTVENILTALIEVAGTVLAEEGIAVETYSEVLEKAGKHFGFSHEECRELAKLATQRNRLVHRYLDLKWQVIMSYRDTAELVEKLIDAVLNRESDRSKSPQK